MGCKGTQILTFGLGHIRPAGQQRREEHARYVFRKRSLASNNGTDPTHEAASADHVVLVIFLNERASCSYCGLWSSGTDSPDRMIEQIRTPVLTALHRFMQVHAPGSYSSHELIPGA